MISRTDLRYYQGQVDGLASMADQTTASALRAWLDANPTAGIEQVRAYVMQLTGGIIDIYGDAAGTASADFYESQAPNAGYRASSVVPVTALDEEQLDKVVRYQLGKYVAGDTPGLAKQMGHYASTSTKLAANHTTMDAARKDNVRYARILQGERTCTFCVMLSSRDFIYASEKSAGAYDKWHNNCDCKVVASNEGVEGYDPDELYARWNRFRDIDGMEDDDGNALSKERKNALKEEYLASVGV